MSVIKPATATRQRRAKIETRPCPTCDRPRALPNGAWLRERRQAAELTLLDMAARLGCSIVYLSDVERGRRNVTEKIAKAYGKLDAAA